MAKGTTAQLYGSTAVNSHAARKARREQFSKTGLEPRSIVGRPGRAEAHPVVVERSPATCATEQRTVSAYRKKEAATE
eukprot:COSAG01_NODE_59875_length_297_cov_3.641414_1_plen_77_part_10